MSAPLWSLTRVGIYMDGQDRQDEGGGGGSLTLGEGSSAPTGDYEWPWIPAFRRNDGGLGAIHRAPTEKPTLVSYGPPAAADWT